MRLCDIPWEDLQIGDVVIQNQFRGKITQLNVKNKYAGRHKDNSIVVVWDTKPTTLKENLNFITVILIL